MPDYDLFLSYNKTDQEAVTIIANRLRDETHLEPFLDRWHLVPGEPWQEALEEALDASRACTVFLGPGGLGTWENEEMRAALDIRADRPDFRVIPVLLPGARLPERGRLPRFLARHTWVDFRPGLDDARAFHELVCGIQGIAPGAEGVTEAEAVCPFRGLQVFDEEHAVFFFGREALTQHLVEQLREDRFLAVLGPSGSGKSSLARAGLVPQVREGGLPASERWSIVILKPGPHPLETLAARLLPHLDGGADPLAARGSLLDALRKNERGLHGSVQVALASAPDSQRLLLVVDQFEELFTLCHDESARSGFIANLLYASAIAGGQTVAVVTMRADFFGKCAAYPELAARLAERDVLVGPMSEGELHRAMEGPAQAVGLHYEKGLVETILTDLGNEPGTLPLLQHTLLELWERRRGGWLTIDAYREINGVQGALAQRADSVYARLTSEQQEAARRVLLRLTQPGEGTEDTRRRATFMELLPAEGKATDVEAAVQELADARLLTTGKDERGDEIVDVAHEALIRGWPRLQGWIDEDRAALRTHRRLTEAVIEWEDSQRDESYLHRGARLAEAREWAEVHADEMNPLEREFLEASVEAQEARRITARRRVQRVIAALVTGLVVISLLAIFSWRNSQEAQHQQAIAERRTTEVQSLALADVARQELSGNNTDLAIALALEANRIDRPPAQVQSILAEAAYAPGTRRRLVGHTDAVRSVAFSPDGRTALSGSQDNSLILWDIESGTEIRRFEGHAEKVYSVAFSPDGRTALSSSHDRTVRLWDIESGEEIRRFVGHSAWVYSVAFSPDGRTALSCSDDDILILWDIESGTEIRRWHSDVGAMGVAFSPDGRTALSRSSDGVLVLWDIESGTEIRRFEGHEGSVWGMAFSPDGRTAISGAYDGILILWDVESGTEIRRFEGHNAPVLDVDFSSDGRTALSGSYDGIVILWDVESGTEIRRFEGHTAPVVTVAFSPDGRTALSGSGNPDCDLRLWDLENGAAIRRFVGHTQAVNSVAFSPDGRIALSGSGDKSLVLWNIENGEEIRRFEGHIMPVTSVAFSPDGHAALSGSHDYGLILWDVESAAAIHRFEGHTARVLSVAFSPDGRTALSGSGNPDCTLCLWDLENGAAIRRFVGHTQAVNSVAFSPDGRTALSGSTDGSLILWDIETGEMIRRFVGHADAVRSVAFSLDGHIVLSGSADGGLILWNIESGEAMRRFVGHTDGVNSVAFGPDDRIALSGSADSSLILWDIESGEEIFRFLGHGDQVNSVAFSPDGHTALSGSGDRSLLLWRMSHSLDLDELIAWTHANRYIRELTCIEREQYRIEPFCDKGSVFQITAPSLVARGERFATQGMIEEAIADYTEAQDLDPMLEISAGSWNTLCWFGNLWGYAADVTQACERAVELDPDNGNYRDSRGLARALIGDYPGAIEDFEFYVGWLKENDKYEPDGPRRDAWIAELEAGQNPFDATTLEALRNE